MVPPPPAGAHPPPDHRPPAARNRAGDHRGVFCIPGIAGSTSPGARSCTAWTARCRSSSSCKAANSRRRRGNPKFCRGEWPYQPEYLDQLCLSGEVSWGRLSPHPAFERQAEERRRVRPTRVAPLAIFLRDDASWLLATPQPSPKDSLSHPAREVLAVLETRGASFFADLDARHRPLGQRSGGRSLGTGGRRFGDRRWIRESARAARSQAPAGRRPRPHRASAARARALGVAAPHRTGSAGRQR
jgi:hypothetical protein